MINITHSDALLPEPRVPENVKNLVLVIDYHPTFRDVPKLIKDHLQILYESPCMKKVFSSNKTCIRTGFWRTKNLKDLLPSVLSHVNSAESVSSDALGCFRCDQKVCCLPQFSTPSKTYQKRPLQGRAIKSDNHYLATQITSFIVPYVYTL